MNTPQNKTFTTEDTKGHRGKAVALLAGLAALGGAVRTGLNDFIDNGLRAGKRKAQQHPGTYIGCKKDKFATMTRQRLRAEATKKIMAEVKAKFQLPRRVLRAIVRTRVNREWRRAA